MKGLQGEDKKLELDVLKQEKAIRKECEGVKVAARKMICKDSSFHYRSGDWK